MGKLLITGATGYIGGQVAEYYLSQDVEIRLLVRDPQRLSEKLRASCEFHRGDLTLPRTLADAVANIESVINCAGLLGKWATPYQKLWEVNVRGTENLILPAFQAGVKRFIHLSAGGVTGPLGSEPADETYLPRPGTDYERSKWEGEKLALELARKENLNLLVVRPTFTYGPGDPHKLPLFRAVQANRFAFIGAGLTTIHPVFIADLISGIDLALKSDLRAECVIIGGARPVSKRELIWGIADVLGVRRPQLKLPVWAAETLAFICEEVASVLGFQPPLTHSRVLMLSRNWGYSIAKAQQMLGYRPKIGLNEGLTQTALWYREHRWL